MVCEFVRDFREDEPGKIWIIDRRLIVRDGVALENAVHDVGDKLGPASILPERNGLGEPGGCRLENL